MIINSHSFYGIPVLYHAVNYQLCLVESWENVGEKMLKLKNLRRKTILNIIIFYEHLAREWEATCRLRDLFEENGDHAEIFSIIFERMKAYSRAKKIIPDVLIMPFFVDAEHETFVSDILDVNPDVKVINLHHEEISSKRSISFLIPTTPFAKNGSFHFVWGEHFKNVLMNNGVKEENIFITGNIRNDLCRAAGMTKSELAEKYGLSPAKKWILFAENRGWLMGRDNLLARQILSERGLSFERFDINLKNEKENLAVFTAQFKKFTPEFAAEFEFIYRPHPGTVLNYEVPECVHIIGDRSIYDWIDCCDLFLTCESTSIFEAEIIGKPCAIVPSMNKPEEQDKVAGVWEFPQIENVYDITNELINEITEKNRTREPIYPRYLGVIDGHAADRVVEATKLVLNMNISDEDKKFAHSTAKQNLKQFAYENLTWLMVKLNLLDAVRFPHSAYGEKRDIPYSAENSWINLPRGGGYYPEVIIFLRLRFAFTAM